MRVDVDDSQWPLVTMRLEGEMGDELAQAHIAAVRSLLDRNHRFALIRIPNVNRPPNAGQRRMMVEHLTTDRARLARLCVGAAFVITSPVVRGGLTAILWVAPMPHPHIIVGAQAEAEAWCRQRIAAGVL